MKYLREAVSNSGDFSLSKELDIFEGDILTDKEYWTKQGYSVTYFKLEELKDCGCRE